DDERVAAERVLERSAFGGGDLEAEGGFHGGARQLEERIRGAGSNSKDPKDCKDFKDGTEARGWSSLVLVVLGVLAVLWVLVHSSNGSHPSNVRRFRRSSSTLGTCSYILVSIFNQSSPVLGRFL